MAQILLKKLQETVKSEQKKRKKKRTRIAFINIFAGKTYVQKLRKNFPRGNFINYFA